MAGSRSQLTPLALAALAVLHERPRHPYEIHQIMRDRQEWRLFKLTPGSLYHAIERLERDGLVEIVETSREGRRPERTTYRLTEAGRDAFAERLRALVGEPATEYPLYPVAVAFLHRLDPEDALNHLRRRAITLEANLAGHRVISRRLTEDGTPPMYWMDVRLQEHMVEAELSWTTWLIDELESGRTSWPTSGGTKLSVVHNEETA